MRDRIELSQQEAILVYADLTTCSRLLAETGRPAQATFVGARAAMVWDRLADGGAER